MSIKLTSINNCDDVYLTWTVEGYAKGVIPDCIGFGIQARRNGDAPFLLNRMGFKDDKPKKNEKRPSDVWPFQSYRWSDHAADLGDTFEYRVVAMIGKPGKLKQGEASDWTKPVKLDASVGDGISCYFNRGFVLSQFMGRLIEEHQLTPATIKGFLQGPEAVKVTEFLAGELGLRMRAMLDTALKDKSVQIYAALYELEEEPLINGLLELGDRAHVVLSNGSIKKRPGDQNAAARKRLKAKVDLTDRLCSPPFLGHNKFVVLTKKVGNKETPFAVWTGSTNWTFTGLHTQINNGIYFENQVLAEAYLEQWHALRNASSNQQWGTKGAGTMWKDGTKDVTLVGHNTKVRGPFKFGPANVRVWFTRTGNHTDIEDLKQLVLDAKDGILAVMFNAGDEPLKTIIQRQNEGFYVRGVVNTIPKGAKELIQMLDDKKTAPFSAKVVEPTGTGKGFANWAEEFTRGDFIPTIGYAITHSKIIVIDPFGKKPVVVTGSHNFSKSASEGNDENMLIIEGHSELARAYATHCLSVYDHYRWRQFKQQVKMEEDPTTGYLAETQDWQGRFTWNTTQADLKFFGLG